MISETGEGSVIWNKIQDCEEGWRPRILSTFHVKYSVSQQVGGVASLYIRTISCHNETSQAFLTCSPSDTMAPRNQRYTQ